MYKIVYASTRVNRDIEKIPVSIRKNFIKTMEKEIAIPLNKNIRPLQKYKNKNPKRFRLKLDKYDDYRIIFSKDKKIKEIKIYEITLRKDAYN